ncbi:MAG TPA: TMEM165/GDT1 family protein [Thermoplasmata archaeon]|nr:TMEM165/GDT1 family protein [Thermoplasmata archaeon]
MADDLVASFLIVFAVIGGTELIDRTNFALIGLAARNKPASVWAGAAGAFVITTTLAVVIGAALLAALGGHVVYLRVGGGVFLLGYAGYLLVVPESHRQPPTGRSAIATAFLLILLLELGDTTMVFTIVFVSTMPNALVVGVAAALALITVAGSGAIIGSRLGARVEPAALERLVVVVLTIVGVLTIVYALDPGLLPAVGG